MHQIVSPMFDKSIEFQSKAPSGVVSKKQNPPQPENTHFKSHFKSSRTIHKGPITLTCQLSSTLSVQLNDNGH